MQGLTGVAVVESGPRHIGAARWGTALPPHYPDAATAGASLGGRSLRWHGVCLRLEPWALADPKWPAAVVADLTAGGCRPGSYGEVEADLERWAGRPLAGAGDDGHPDFLQFLGALGIGTAEAVPRAVRPPAGPGPSLPQAYTALPACLDPDGPSSPPTILGGRRALELIAGRPGAVSGVRVVHGSTVETVGCGAAVLAAGALENARLVAQLSSDASVAAVLEPQDHLVEGFVVEVPAAALPLAPDMEGFALVRGDARARSNVFLKTARVGADGTRRLDAWVMGEQQPSGTRLEFATAGGPPWRAFVRPALSAEDRATIAGGRRRLGRLWAALGAAGSRSPLRFADFLRAPRTFPQAQAMAAGAAGTPVTYAWPLGTVEHEGGVLPFGGVLDAGANVAGFDGVMVVGPASFPRLAAANPSLTTLALARRAAAALTR